MNQLLIDLGLAPKLSPAQAEALSAALEEKQNAVLAKRVVDLTNERDAALAQLVEVQDNRTGKAPCERFCEALAAKKMFDNLQRHNQQLKAQVEQLKAMLKQQASIVVKYTYPLPDKDCNYSLAKDALDYCEKSPAQCLAARDAEIKAQAVEEYCASFESMCVNQLDGDDVTQDMVDGWKAGIMDCRIAGRKYANQLRQQAKGE